MGIKIGIVETSARLLDATGGAEFNNELVEDAIDEELATIGTELLRELDVLINRDAFGNGGASHQFADSHRDEQHIHLGNTVELPAFEMRLDEVLTFLSVAKCFCQQVASELHTFHIGGVVLIVHKKHRRGLIERSINRAQEHEIVLSDLVEIVLPKEIATVEPITEGVIIHEEFENLHHEELVVLEGVVGIDIIAIDLRTTNRHKQTAKDVLGVGPVDFESVALLAISEIVVKDSEEAIIGETLGWVEVLLSGFEFLGSLFKEKFGGMLELKESGELPNT